MQKLQELREIIIKAVPDIVGKEDCPCNGWKYVIRTECKECRGLEGFRLKYRKIRLVDVLLAVKKIGYSSTEKWRLQKDNVFKLVELWNLKKNDLNNQSEETINFLHGLLK